MTILEIVALYPPADKTETFDVMNALEDRLQHSNSAVVLATVKCFLRATLELPEVHQQVFERMKAPLLTLADGEPGARVRGLGAPASADSPSAAPLQRVQVFFLPHRRPAGGEAA